MTVIRKLKPAPRHILALDPGKATGWCRFIDGVIDDWGICRSIPTFQTFLQDYEALYGKPDIVIYEDFIVFKNKANQQAGSKMEAPQVIGQIKLWASMLKIPTVRQMSSILQIAKKWSGVDHDKGDHNNSHHKAAMNHGVYWLVKNQMMLPQGM